MNVPGFFMGNWQKWGVARTCDAPESEKWSVALTRDAPKTSNRSIAHLRHAPKVANRVKSIILCKSLNVVISSGHHAHYTCKNVRALFSQFSWKSINIEPIKRSAEAMFG